MTAKRVIALLVAAALVVGAVLVRRNVIDKRSTSTSTSPTETTVSGSAADREVTCTPDVADACRLAGFNVREMAVTDLLAVNPAPALIVAADPVGAMVVARARPTKTDTKPVASSPLVVAGPDERLKVLEATCPGVTPKCLVTRAGAPWTDLPGGLSTWSTLDEQTRDAARLSDGLVAFTTLVAAMVEPDQLSTATMGAAASRAGQIVKASKGRNDPVGDAIAVRFRLVVAPKATFSQPVAQRQIGTSTVTISVTALGATVPDSVVKGLVAKLGNTGWGPGVATSGPDAIAGEAALDFWKRT